MWLRVFKNWACCQKWLTSNSINGSFLFAHTRDLNAGSWNFVMRSTGIDTPLDPSLRPHRLESWSINQSMQLKRQSTGRRTLSQVPLFWAGVIIRTATTETKTRVGSQGWYKDKDLFELRPTHSFLSFEFASRPCDELLSCPGWTLPLPYYSWDRLQQTLAILSAGESRYSKWMDGPLLLSEYINKNNLCSVVIRVAFFGLLTQFALWGVKCVKCYDENSLNWKQYVNIYIHWSIIRQTDREILLTL